MSESRREFVKRTAIGVIGAAAISSVRDTLADPTPEKPLVVSTWPFGKASNDAAIKILLAGGSLLDAVEQGIWVTESDVNNKSVGLHGTPNAAGVPQLDASIMFGPGHKAGSVGALEGIIHPISAARRVMEKSKHVMLVGEGARIFALSQGLESIDVSGYAALYEKWRADHPAAAPRGHDTIALLVLGADGNIAGGCSTSGLGGKLPGRVGDSPILGSGLYVDNEVGAAGATGVGENVMRYCASFQIVELMRQGLHPREACRQTVERIIRSEASPNNLSINFVALNKKGEFGADGTDEKFAYSVATASASQVLPNPAFVK
jgi:isoaspartyl peptidase/L-asparaginase-like protein (Ntn-hydrolase superfamily)